MKNPIVILSGWRLSKNNYDNLKSKLIQMNYQVLIPDLPGFTNNFILSKSYNLDNYVEYIINQINSLKYKKIILIGHSFGGRIAIKIASKFPTIVDRLILTGTPGFPPVDESKRLFFLVISKIGKFFFQFPLLSEIQDLARKILYRLAGSTDYMKTDGILRDTFTSVIREDLLLPMRKIFIPTLLIWGQVDKVVPVEIAVKMQKVIKNSRLLILANSTHKLPYQEPDKFIRSIFA